jgi:hypothetical protein
MDDEVQERVEDIVEDVTGHADEVIGLMGDSNGDTFSVISVTMTTNYARQINFFRRVRANHGEELPETLSESLDELIDRFQKIDLARQYFKSIYLQEELASLSRLLFYAGLPCLLTLVGTLVLFTGPTAGALPRATLLVVLAGGITAGLAPLSILFAFILRVATVTQRTAATLPFTTPAQEQ